MQVFSAQNSVVCIIWYLFLYSCYIISILCLHMFIILNRHYRLGVTMVVRQGDLVGSNSGCEAGWSSWEYQWSWGGVI